MQLSLIWKMFSQFFLHLRNLDSILNIFKKKNDPHSWSIFELLLHFVKRCYINVVVPISEDSLPSNITDGLKHCWNPNESTFTRFIHPCEGNSGWKCLSERYQKY